MKSLVYDQLYVGRRLKSFTYQVDPEKVREYVNAIGEDWGYYHENQIAPPTMAAIYTLLANRTEGPLPPGSIQVSQEFEFLRPTRFGDTLVTIATVSEKYLRKDRKYVELTAETLNGKKEVVVKAKTVGIWGE
ncbi:MAG: MaoC family dehydratase N-terminal domain-containing protein [Desulfotomaculaceae bacterium]